MRVKNKQKVLRRGGKNTQKNYNKGLNDPDSRDGWGPGGAPAQLCHLQWLPSGQFSLDRGAVGSQGCHRAGVKNTHTHTHIHKERTFYKDRGKMSMLQNQAWELENCRPASETRKLQEVFFFPQRLQREHIYADKRVSRP